jgi:hypothetical protein
MSERTVEHITNASADAFTEGGKASSTALHELTKAYQELAVRNASNLTAAIKALSAIRNPAEFIELQQKLIKDGVQAAMSDSQTIAHLTAAVFTSAFEPVKKQIDAIH